MSNVVARPSHMTPPHLRPYDSVLETIGWTPLIRLARIGAGVQTPIYGKAEYANPGGSVKDRIGLAIIEDAERRGELRPGGTIVEGTSGNTGVGLAIAAALRGYRCVFTMVGLGGANAGELVVGGRGVAFICLEHFTGRVNPETYGMARPAIRRPVSRC